MAETTDVRFWFDPVCPYCWMTSTWVRTVAPRRNLAVDWRFISLRLLNAHVDYDAQFPPEYEAGHTAGLRLLRVRAPGPRAGRPGGARPVLRGARDGRSSSGRRSPSTPAPGSTAGPTPSSCPCSSAPGCPRSWPSAGRRAPRRDDPGRDRRGAGADRRDVGTPIIQLRPTATGVAFFGPVISRMPAADEAEQLWDHVVGLARFPGSPSSSAACASARSWPRSASGEDEVGLTEDWHGGSRRQHR